MPFSYSPDDTEWGAYPYLVPAARYLVGGEYIDVSDAGPVRLHRIAASPAIGGPFDLYVAYPVSNEIVPVDLSSVLGMPEIGTACPRNGLAPVVASNEVVVPPTGLILVPPEYRLWFPNGDLDMDGEDNEEFDLEDEGEDTGEDVEVELEEERESAEEKDEEMELDFSVMEEGSGEKFSIDMDDVEKSMQKLEDVLDDFQDDSGNIIEVDMDEFKASIAKFEAEMEEDEEDGEDD